MTAPLRQTEPNFVKVALGARGYDILIGRGLLADLGQRIKALRSGVRVAIVTDETVGKIHLVAAEAALNRAALTVRASLCQPAKIRKTMRPSKRSARQS